jgi:protein-S-isoprenylcysteine O-methyltransferase Ste14
MMTFNAVLDALWIGFYTYWLISAIGVKKKARGAPWFKGAGVRILLVVAAIMLLRGLRIRKLFFHPHGQVLGVIGIFVCVLGFAIAVWARLHLGRNWGVPMSLRQGHELVTTGPYKFVRHPIYTGILLAMLGSSLVSEIMWLVAFLICCPYFVYSAKTEEHLMMQQFPDQYPEYKARTHALVPFVW